MGEISYQAFRKNYGKKKNKFGAKKTTVDGETFPSKAEAAVFQLFKVRQASGEVTELTRYETIYLSDARVSYKPDWSFVETSTGTKIFVEVKGVVTDRFRLIKKLWKAYGPTPLEIWKVNHRGPYLDEVITPA